MTTCRTNVSVAVVEDRLWAVGGFSGKVFLNTVEYLDPETNEWTSFIALPEEMLEGSRPSSANLETGSEDESSVITFSASGPNKHSLIADLKSEEEANTEPTPSGSSNNQPEQDVPSDGTEV